MFSGLKRLATQSFIYTAGDVLNRAFAFLLIPLYTAFLDPSDYGILAITSTVAGILSILYLQSLEGVLTRFHYDYPDKQQRKKYYGTIWLLMISVSLLASLFLESIGEPLSRFLFKDVPYVPYFQLIVWTTFITNSSFILMRAVLRVQEKPVAFVGLNLTMFVVNTALIIYFVVINEQGALGNLQGRFWGSLIVAVPVVIVYLKGATLSWSWEPVQKSLKFAIPLVPHLLSLWILNLSDRLILQNYVTLSELGIYSLGYQVASILQILAFSAMNAWSPFFYKSAGEPNAPEMLSRFSTYYWLIVIMLGTGLATLAQDTLVVMISRPAYYNAYQVVPWVVLGFVMRSFYFVFVTALYYAKQVKALPVVTIISGTLNIGLNLLLIPRFGYMAAAVNTFVAYAFQTSVMYFLAQRAYWMPYEYLRIAKLFGVSIVLFWIASVLPIMPGWIGLLVKSTLLITFPAWLYLVRFLTADELGLLRRVPYQITNYFRGIAFKSAQ